MGNNLVTVDFNLVGAGNVGAIFAEEMEGLRFKFDQVKIPSGGGLAFTIPNAGGQPIITPEIYGIIVDRHNQNAYYQDEYTGAKNPPTCASNDGKIGYGSPGGPCVSCPNNQWDQIDPFTKEVVKGKLCQNRQALYVLRDGDAIPIYINLPPTSENNITDYIGKVVVPRGLCLAQVVTKISLAPDKNAKGIAYSKAVFEIAGVLSEEKGREMLEYAKNIREITRATNLMIDGEAVEAEGTVVG